MMLAASWIWAVRYTYWTTTLPVSSWREKRNDEEALFVKANKYILQYKYICILHCINAKTNTILWKNEGFVFQIMSCKCHKISSLETFFTFWDIWIHQTQICGVCDVPLWSPAPQIPVYWNTNGFLSVSIKNWNLRCSTVVNRVWTNKIIANGICKSAWLIITGIDGDWCNNIFITAFPGLILKTSCNNWSNKL